MVVARDLGPVRYALCASAEWASRNRLPQTLAELRRTPLITSGGVSGRVRMMAAHDGHEEEIEFIPTLMARSYPFVLDCILGGLGLVPDYMTQARVQAGDMVSVLADYQFSINRNHMYLMYMPNRYQSRTTITFIDFLTDKMGLLRMLRKSDT